MEGAGRRDGNGRWLRGISYGTSEKLFNSWVMQLMLGWGWLYTARAARTQHEKGPHGCYSIVRARLAFVEKPSDLAGVFMMES